MLQYVTICYNMLQYDCNMLPIICFSNSLAFATEPVLGSLANLLGNYDRMPTVVPPAIKVTHCCDIQRH